MVKFIMVLRFGDLTDYRKWSILVREKETNQETEVFRLRNVRRKATEVAEAVVLWKNGILP
jgi:hypothetical protein